MVILSKPTQMNHYPPDMKNYIHLKIFILWTLVISTLANEWEKILSPGPNPAQMQRLFPMNRANNSSSLILNVVHPKPFFNFIFFYWLAMSHFDIPKKVLKIKQPHPAYKLCIFALLLHICICFTLTHPALYTYIYMHVGLIHLQSVNKFHSAIYTYMVIIHTHAQHWFTPGIKNCINLDINDQSQPDFDSPILELLLVWSSVLRYRDWYQCCPHRYWSLVLRY